MSFLDTDPSGSSNIPTILAIHGAPEIYHDFQHLIERLGVKGYRVIVLHFPDMKFTDYHSTEEKYDLLTDFLIAINVTNFDLAFLHSSGVYPKIRKSVRSTEVSKEK